MARSYSANRAGLDPSELATRLGPWSSGSGPLYAQLAAGVTRLIREGVLRPGDPLPPERALAVELDVARGTVVAAYDRLRADAIIERRQGSGTRVTGASTGGPPTPTVSSRDLLFEDIPETIDLLKAVPPPSPAVQALVETAALTRTPEAWTSVEPAGLFELRVAIAERYSASGLATEPEQIMVTSGAQQAIAIVLEGHVGRDDNVLAEHLTWPGFTETVRRCGGRVHGVAMDAEGIVPADLRRACERLRPVVICLNPHHHNPTGTRLSTARRREVAEIAAEYGVAVLEDRVAASLAFDGVVPPPLAAHGPEVLGSTVDSLSKTVWAGLRIGWVRTDTATVQALRGRKALADLWTSIPSQLLALEVLPHLDDLVRERTGALRRQYAALVDALGDGLPDWHVHPVRGGMVVRVDLPHGSAGAFARFATRYGVAIAAGAQFSTSTVDDTFVRIPFTLPESVTLDAVDRLAAAWRAAPSVRSEHPEPDSSIV